MPNIQRLQSLDMLRGVAVFLVFSYHSMLLIFWGYDIYYLPSGWIDISKLWHVSNILIPFKLGWVGVELFFVLSGFSIHYATLKIQPIEITLNFMKIFYEKRFFRLYPAYLLTIFVIILIPFLVSLFRPINFNSPSPKILINNLLFFYNYTCCTLSPAFWSLGVEIQLYLIYPFFLLAKRYFSFQSILVIALFVTLLSPIILDLIKLPELKIGFVGCRLFNWLLGAYLAERFNFGLHPIFTKKYHFTLLLLFFLGLLSYFPCLDLAYTTASFISFLIIQKLIYSNEIQTKINGLFCTIGKSSYSIYLLHMPLMPYLYAIYHKIIPTNPYGDMFIGIPTTFVMIFVVGWLMFTFIETPMINIGKKFIDSKQIKTIG